MVFSFTSLLSGFFIYFILPAVLFDVVQVELGCAGLDVQKRCAVQYIHIIQMQSIAFNAKQFHYMVKFGMTPAGAIRAATSSAADLIDRSKDVGTLEAGKYADMIAVTANPLDRIEVLEHVSFVMKGGKVYKDELGAAKPAR